MKFNNSTLNQLYRKADVQSMN